MNFSFSIEKALKVIKRFFLFIIIVAIAFYAVGYELAKRSTSVSYFSYTELYIHTLAEGVEDYSKYIESEAKYVDTYLLTINTYKFYSELSQELIKVWEKRVEDGELTDEVIKTKYGVDNFEKLKARASAGYLKGSVSTSKRAESAIVRFTVYTYSAALTRDVTTVLRDYIDDYLYQKFRVKNVEVVEDPRPAAASVSQSQNFSLILAAFGAIVTFLICYIKDSKDTRIRSISDLNLGGIPILGVVPSFDGKPSKRAGKYSYSGYDSYSRAASTQEDASSPKSSAKKNKK